MTQRDANRAERRRYRQLHAEAGELADRCEGVAAELRRITGRADEIVLQRPATGIGQAAVEIGLEAANQIKTTGRLWNELAELQRAALGGQETP